MKIRIDFNSNQGSVAVDALAATFQGNWDSRSSTNDSGIITGVDPDAQEWVEEVLNEDDNVISYTLFDE